MDAAGQRIDIPRNNSGANPGMLRPPLVFLTAIVLGIGLNLAWPLPFMPAIRVWLGPTLVLFAVLLYVLSYRSFRAAGTPVRGNKRTTTIVRTGPYRFSRNPIYLAFVLFVLGLAVWINALWLIATLVPAVSLIAIVVIPREERFLECNFSDQYSEYRARVRRWL